MTRAHGPRPLAAALEIDLKKVSRAGGLSAEAISAHGSNLSSLEAVDAELNRGNLDDRDRPTATVDVVRCAVIRLIDDPGQRKMLMETLVKPTRTTIGAQLEWVSSLNGTHGRSYNSLIADEERARRQLAKTLEGLRASPCLQDVLDALGRVIRRIAEDSLEASQLAAMAGLSFDSILRDASTFSLADQFPVGRDRLPGGLTKIAKGRLLMIAALGEMGLALQPVDGITPTSPSLAAYLTVEVASPLRTEEIEDVISRMPVDSLLDEVAAGHIDTYVWIAAGSVSRIPAHAAFEQLDDFADQRQAAFLALADKMRSQEGKGWPALGPPGSSRALVGLPINNS